MPTLVERRGYKLSGERNNNKKERLNGEIRDREKVVRGIKTKDSVLIHGYQMYHNYLRPHMGLDEKRLVKSQESTCYHLLSGLPRFKTQVGKRHDITSLSYV